MSDKNALKCPLSARIVLLAGVGNIGSHVPALLAQAGVGTIRLVDRDVVEQKNLIAQDYRPADVGRPKAEALAERLRERFPDTTFQAYSLDLEDLPLGVAAVDLVLGGLDSRRARQVLCSEIAWPLGVPVIDGGVGDGGLGRVQVFVPGAETACLECTWGAADYRLASAEYPCIPGASAGVAPTGAPAFQGAFTAALMASEAVRLLSAGGIEESYEIPFDLNQQHMRRFSLRRAARCRCDHAITTETLSAGDTIADLLRAIAKRFTLSGVSLCARRAVGRFLSIETLRSRESEPLSALGLIAGDRIRARAGSESAWLCVE